MHNPLSGTVMAPGAPGLGPEARLDLARQLDQARSRIEERFLEGGQVLGAALDSISVMRELLGRVLDALDTNTVMATVADLDSTTRRLLDLPARQEEEYQRMTALASLGTVLQSHVDDMQETLRYLRTVAVTVKIAGADAAEFGEFANDMLTRIQAGREQVDGFAVRLGVLLGQARIAATLHHNLRAQYERSLPGLTRELESNARRMQDYHATIRDLAGLQDDLAGDTEARIARTLSALQIGDITRQRIEHVQAGLTLLSEERHDISATDAHVVEMVLSRQLVDLTQEFHEGSGDVAQGLAALAANMTRMLALGRRADRDGRAGNNGRGEGAFLSAMERAITSAQSIVARIESAGLHSREVSQTAVAIAQELTTAVSVITTIRSEIQFMAINTSLRCRRLGEAGRAIVVVATELRNFAIRLEDVSERLLVDLDRVARLIPPSSAGADANEDVTQPATPASLGATLDLVLNKIHNAHHQMQDELHELTIHGEQLAGEISFGAARLDFGHELGNALDGAITTAEPVLNSQPHPLEPAATTPQAATRILARIRESYTMARERQLHDELLGLTPLTPAIAAPAQMASHTTSAHSPLPEEDELAAIFF